MENRLDKENFQVISVHTPEFENERVRKNIEVKVEEFGLHHPIMIDNDSSYWACHEESLLACILHPR